MRWRKLLVDDILEAGMSWRGERTRQGLREQLARLEGWSDAGFLSLSDHQLAFEGAVPHYMTLKTIEGIEWSGRVVWIRRRRAYDWLLRCRTREDAEALVARLHAVRPDVPVSPTSA